MLRFFFTNPLKNNQIRFSLNQKAHFSKDIFKRPVSESDVDHEKFRRKFLDIENKEWVVDDKNKNSGKVLYYPKYGNSFWDPGLYKNVDKKK
jgi:hypothetical protein